MKNYILMIGVAAALLTGSCKKWDDHTTINSPAFNETLMEQINKNPDLSVLAGYIVKTGLDSLLNASKNLTVFAPDNSALSNLSQDIVSDPTQLKALLLNHISAKAYYTRDESVLLRVPMLNGKRIAFNNGHWGNAALTQSDIAVKNGVLHVVDKAISPLPNIWEFIEAQKSNYAQNAYISSLKYMAQDPALATLDSINPQTGEPVYKPNTGIVEINTYRTKVYDIANEDSLYTYILLTDAAFNTEKTALLPYFKAGSADTANMNAAWSVVKDLTVKGMYTTSQLPAVLLSKFGVHIPLNASAILQTQEVSNGIVYIVNAAPALLSEKIPAVYVQGETPIGFSTTDPKTLVKVFYRQRMNPETGLSFNDIYANLGSSGANFYINYFSNDLYTVKYKVYWVALSDRVLSGQGDDAYGSDSTLSQLVQIRPGADADSILFNSAAPLLPNTYTEIYIGDFTNTDYNWLLSYPPGTPDGKSYIYNPATKYIRLLAPSSVTSGKPYNITLDYLKFVPVLD
ncbi:fasciclin domain-containing protein [Niabella aurantiaca]|uniref:fasciclin domain-containing protein n=1 Tax=Niabella aurantiaca TaxID=379900 RepID=UPI00035FF123|nr:fasciclin domain-containing protein [Niabella aurantiaca]